MNKYRFKIFLTLLSAVVIYAACKKMDQQIIPSNNLNAENTFFNTHPPDNPLVKAIAQYMERQNSKEDFVQRALKKFGIPYWDKALLYTAPPSGTGRSASDTSYVVYIPIVEQGEDFVKAQLTVKTTATDTTFSFLEDNQYDEFGFAPNADSLLNGLKVFCLFANHERNVFGRTRFTILDNRILKGQSSVPIDSNKQYMVELDTTAAPTLMAGPDPLPHSSCILVNEMIAAGYTVHYTMVGTVCVISSYSLGGGGTGTGGGGGGSGGTGWEGNGNPPPPDEPIDSMLNRYSRAINAKSDSIFQLSMNSANKEEWGFPILQKNNDVYAKRCSTIHRTDQVILDRFTEANEFIIGELHTHPDPNPNPLSRSASSGDDFETFNVNSRLRYTLFVECGNVRYALVIENVSLARAYLATHSWMQLMEDQNIIAQQQPNYANDWQNATQVALLQLLGSSGSCGFGFYKSDVSKTKFNKLN